MSLNSPETIMSWSLWLASCSGLTIWLMPSRENGRPDSSLRYVRPRIVAIVFTSGKREVTMPQLTRLTSGDDAAADKIDLVAVRDGDYHVRTCTPALLEHLDIGGGSAHGHAVKLALCKRTARRAAVQERDGLLLLDQMTGKPQSSASRPEYDDIHGRILYYLWPCNSNSGAKIVQES